METVGILDKLPIELVDSSVAQCHDCKCKHKRCCVDNFGDLIKDRSDYCKKAKKKESKRKSSYHGFGSIASVSQDEFGWMVDFDGSISKSESDLDSKVFYHY